MASELQQPHTTDEYHHMETPSKWGPDHPSAALSTCSSYSISMIRVVKVIRNVMHMIGYLFCDCSDLSAATTPPNGQISPHETPSKWGPDHPSLAPSTCSSYSIAMIRVVKIDYHASCFVAIQKNWVDSSPAMKALLTSCPSSIYSAMPHALLRYKGFDGLTAGNGGSVNYPIHLNGIEMGGGLF